ncbi:uncharacterized protein AB675_10419 [Cyphellophora attinorum]|uniref:Uncharacterized protein n=1 Tax=Cyphellophora attinorum TaxID=1664694 RepID=A0A0N1HIL5_9EURO|nr:uncharacterized protein AB675_10419 [Phialophora attinorum]KPI35956.1 hypothetical protein AB675_10419 [Phialophora attinorum]
MTILLVPGTAQTSLAIASHLANHPSSPSYVLAVRNTDSSPSAEIHHPTITLSLSDPTTWQPAFTSCPLRRGSDLRDAGSGVHTSTATDWQTQKDDPTRQVRLDDRMGGGIRRRQQGRAA